VKPSRSVGNYYITFFDKNQNALESYAVSDNYQTCYEYIRKLVELVPQYHSAANDMPRDNTLYNQHQPPTQDLVSIVDIYNKYLDMTVK
jgi:hypothetical protein